MIPARQHRDATPARATWAGRIADYLQAMFPPAVQLPAAAILFLAVHAGLQGLAGLAPIRLGPRAVAGAATVALLALLLRVQDELKDLATDAALARAGDPRFAARPVVAGRVTPRDLAVLRRAAIAALVLLNLPLGFPLPCAPFAVALGATWLSGRWFFWPRIAKDLVLAFWTHNPLALLYAAYAAAVFARDVGAERLRPGGVVPVLAVYLPVAAWEIARKVRAPEEETAYESWSSRLGWRTAASLPPALCAVSAASFAWTARACGVGLPYAVAVAAALAGVVAASLRFLARPSPRTSARLRGPVEVFAAVAAGGLVAALVFARGVTWGMFG
ncbi:MAG TPA: hypothetical protein VM753_21645 [Anaeromyxobacter sp.]|nr:hypothetical protein [Anaeromyxobacter sp.]